MSLQSKSKVDKIFVTIKNVELIKNYYSVYFLLFWGLYNEKKKIRNVRRHKLQPNQLQDVPKTYNDHLDIFY